MYQRVIKRGLDILLCGAAMLIIWPLFLLIAILIKLDSKGPVYFKQKRVGIHKTHFYIYKFRTMRTDTPKDVPTHLLQDPDAFITRMGKFLRKTSLDELPQILHNVLLKGDMTIIGPRPALWNQYDLIEERDKYGANDVKPGISGWAQIHGRDELEIPVKAKLDGYYAQNISFWLDVKCVLGTVSSVLKSEGVVEGGTGAMEAAASKERPKILICTNHSYMLYQFRRELIQKLMETHEVVISMPYVGHEEDFQEMGCKCIETPIDRRGINPVTDLKLIKAYAKMLKEEKPDEVITFSIKPNIYAGFLCGLKKIPYCCNVQGLGTAFQKKGLASFVTLLYKVAFFRVKKVFFENTSNAEEFRKRKIISRDKQVLLKGAGVNLKYYRYRPYTEEDPIRFLFVGRIMKEKGVDELFRASKKLKEIYHDKIEIGMVGFFEDEYKEKVEYLEQEGIIRFYGFQKEVRPFYEKAHCIVLPSYHEGMSNVLLEAASTGRALITTYIPGCKEAVDEGINGYLCKVKSAKSLYRKMHRFIELTKKEREEMGKNGRRKMQAQFDKDKVVEKTVEAILS